MFVLYLSYRVSSEYINETSPLQQITSLHVETTTYSVFTDIRLFQCWINHDPLPFSDKINYLFEKQIEESKLLLLNKSYLLPPDQQKEILAIAIEQFPEKMILLQNSKVNQVCSPGMMF